MSRSKHQRHKVIKSKRIKQPHPYRSRKIKPYGLKGFCGYGGEIYTKKYGEICVDIINKKRQRRISKQEIRNELNKNEEL